MSLRYEQSYIQNPHVFGSMNLNSNNANFHQRSQNRTKSLNNNYMMGQNSGPKNYQSLNLNNSINQLPNQSKVSYARNIRQRLFQTDQVQQVKKQIEKLSYRNELELQMKADKERKLREKQKIQKEELDRERKFYVQVGKIQAKQPKLKQEPSYMILRSRKGDRHKQKSDKNGQSLDQSRTQSPVPQVHMPKIIKRGGYHNQSTLDNSQYAMPESTPSIQAQIINPQLSRSLVRNKSNHQTQVQQRQIEIIRQRNYEQERITNIIKLQQKMIRKLYNFKDQILKSNNQFNLDKEVQQIRNILKSKPIKLEVWSVKNDEIFNNNNDFYQFPKNNNRIGTRNRNRHNRSRINDGIDLNSHEEQMQRTLTEQHQQKQHQNEKLHSSKRKRQIKLFQSNNDKNYQQVNDQHDQNPQINIPVVLRNRHPSNHQNQEDYEQQ